MSAYEIYRLPRVGPLVGGTAAGLTLAAGVAIWQGTGGAGGPEAEASIVNGSTPEAMIDAATVSVWHMDADGAGLGICTGSLIDEEWVLTAAHCFPSEFMSDETVQQAVEVDGRMLGVQDVQVHPLYRTQAMPAVVDQPGPHQDIALVRLAAPAVGADPLALALPADASTWPAGATATVAGVGAVTTGGGATAVTAAAEVEVLPSSACGVWGPNFDAASHVCTASNVGATCNGDSGGPVVVDRAGSWLQVGVVSFGAAECGSGVPDVHVRVDVHAEWIASVTGMDLAATSTGDPVPGGYWLVTTGGEVVEFGEARFWGDLTGSAAIEDEVVDLAATPSGQGYVLLDETGRLHHFGETVAVGDAVALDPGDRARAAAWTPSGTGLWVFTLAGAVHTLGDAPFFGDMRGIPLQGPVLDATITPSGSGYWMVASDGGIFTFGDATFVGSMGATPLNSPIVAMTPVPAGGGYWMVAADGGIFGFGSAQYRGSIPEVLPPGQALNAPVAGIAAYGNGYVMFATDGGVFSFSDAEFAGSLGDQPPGSPVVAVEVTG